MEGKKSTESGYPAGSYGGGMLTESLDVAANTGMEKNAGVTNAEVVLSGAAVNGGIADAGSGGGSNELMVRERKTRWPTEYDLDEKLRATYIESIPAAPPGFALLTPPPIGNSPVSKRGRCKRKAPDSMGELLGSIAGRNFTPHVLTVYTGEDVAAKILTFAQMGCRPVCILAANGPVSNVTLHQPGSCGGSLLTFEGCFDIVTLRGSYSLSDTGGIKSWAGGLYVSLASSDGRMIGGSVAGLLMAASPIQIVVGSFVAAHHQEARTSASPKSEAPPAESNICDPMGMLSHSREANYKNSSSNKNNQWPDSGPTEHSHAIEWNGFERKPCISRH